MHVHAPGIVSVYFLFHFETPFLSLNLIGSNLIGSNLIGSGVMAVIFVCPDRSPTGGSVVINIAVIAVIAVITVIAARLIFISV